MLCLDNAESCWPTWRPWWRRWRDAAPRLLILATSRERLAVVAEHVHQLAPLPLPSGPDRTTRRSGCSWTGRRAWRRSRRATTWRPSPSCAAGSTACRWPSSSGRRGRRRSASASSPRRSRRARPARRRAAYGRGRHQTLRAVVDASYRLLTPERGARFRAARRLSRTVPARAGADGVRATTGCRPRAIGPLLARLVEQSLVQAGDGRFWLLETLRTYAAERLSEPDAATAAGPACPRRRRPGRASCAGSSGRRPRRSAWPRCPR